MVEEIEDPAGQTVQTATRVAMTAASVVAEQVARYRREQAQRLAQAEGAEAIRLQARWDAQKSAAHSELRAADERWLDRASPRETADLWQTTQVWAGAEPEDFSAEAARIRAEIERRYELDLVEAEKEGRELAEELHQLGDTQRQRERNHEREASADVARAGAISADAGQDAVLDHAEAERSSAAHDGLKANDLDAQADGVDYDSDARRATLSQRVRDGGADTETVNARVTASNANGRPSRLANMRRGKMHIPNRAPEQRGKGAEIQR